MGSSDSVFEGSIPGVYDRCLGPLLFAPFARDLAARVAEKRPRDVLETAAGTGIVTAALVGAVPNARIVATDLNEAMLAVASARLGDARVRFLPCDAQDLPFDDAAFDVIACQFGVMFFPDRVAAYREARRVLRPGGCFLFSAWTAIAENPVTDRAMAAVADLYPDDPPSFFRRVPHGYAHKAVIEADLEAAGFERIAVETVEKRSRSPSAKDAALGLCQGTPLRAEIEARAPPDLSEATRAAAAAIAPLCGPEGVDAPMSAHVVTAWR